jgi:hypothetical protein
MVRRTRGQHASTMLSLPRRDREYTRSLARVPVEDLQPALRRELVPDRQIVGSATQPPRDAGTLVDAEHRGEFRLLWTGPYIGRMLPSSNARRLHLTTPGHVPFGTACRVRSRRRRELVGLDRRLRPITELVRTGRSEAPPRAYSAEARHARVAGTPPGGRRVHLTTGRSSIHHLDAPAEFAWPPAKFFLEYRGAPSGMERHE